MKKTSILFLLVLLAFGPTAWAQGLSGSGTEADPYLITSTADWNTFASNVASGTNYWRQFLKLTADITVSEMVGTSSNKFYGTFDGNGYTLTFNKGTAENPFSEEYCAPFRYIRGATIKNLHVAGTIYTSNKFAGVVGSLDAGYDVNLSYITACRSSLTINSSASGDGTHGGFAGMIPQYQSNIHFTDCLFDGQLLGSTTHSCGGFVGWHKGGEVYFTNCLFAPASVTFDTDNSCTFIRLNGNYSTPNFNHCYYKQAFGTAQGTNASAMDDATLLSNLGATWEIIDGKVVPVMPRRPLTGNGTEQSPYQIASATDWDNLVYNVNTYGETYEGKYFKLMADISVTNMVGGDGTTGNDKCFSGIFDGQGHTITFNVANTTEQYIAPFRRINGATIDGVKLEGTVSSSNRFAGGIVAYAKGTSTVTNCVNSTSITTTKSNASNGGIVGMVGARGTITITGCVFNGEMNGATNSNETWSGILGLCNTNCTATINDCLVDPVSAVAKGNTIHRTTGQTNCSNCYYTKTIGNAQGKRGYSITGGTDVTVANSGTATNYTVSGITSYGTGIEYNGTLYAGDGDSVSLNLTLPDGYTIGTATYTPEGGTATEMVFANGVYSFTMPDANVTINATIMGDGESWETAYLIYNTEQLDLLATRVNGENSNNYNTKYYKLMNDIEYDYDGNVNNNYTAIGNATRSFNGHFDGQSYTISGIRINKSGDSNSDKYQGLFGHIGSGGEVKNVTLTDSDITGHQYTGGIAGYNGGTIDNCQVTASVYIRSIHNACPHHGGIAGINEGTSSSTATISHCTSSATLTHTAQYGGISFGGIAGENQDYGLLTDNLVIGATIPNTLSSRTGGAILGNNNGGEMTHNYYVGCTVNDVENAIDVGCNYEDITTNDGAVPGNVRTVTGYNNSNDGWVFIASPVLDEGGIAPTSVTNLVANPKENYDLYRFNQSATLEWENYKQTGEHYNFNLDNGKGYLYANKEDVTLTFLGTTFKTDIEPVEVPLDYIANTEFAGWNLVGNPFPRAAYVNRSYYVTGENGTIITPVSGSNSTAIKPCTGLMVHTDHANDRVTFRTTAPETTPNRGNLQIALSQSVEAVETPSYKVGPSTLRQAQGSGTLTLDKAILSFNEGDQLAKFVFNADKAKLYIPQNGKDYAIATTEGKGEMPVNFKATEDGTYTLTVNIESVEMEYLHLIDNLTGADVDLLQTPSYSFNAKTTDYESRFKLVFVANGEDVPSTGSGTFAFYSNGSWIISNEGEATLQMVDVNGHLLSSETVNGSVSKAINVAPGVYVLRLVKGNEVKTQKIIVR